MKKTITKKNFITIWVLKKKFHSFNLFINSYIDLKKTKFKEISLNKIFFLNPTHKNLFAIFLILNIGSIFILKKLRKNISLFKSSLTANYYHPLQKITLNINDGKRLVLSATNPDIYLWKSKKERPKKIAYNLAKP